MLNYIQDITEKVATWCRESGVVLVEDKFYKEDNHQYAMEEYMADYWTSKGYTLTDDSDMGEAMAYTDWLFREGKIHGFDLYFDKNMRYYLISHYKRAVEDPKVMQLLRSYAKEMNCSAIGTYTNEDSLGGKCYLIA